MNARIASLLALREALHPGQTLDEVQWLELIRILDAIIEGYDIREWYGIDAKPGRPPTTRGLQKWIVLHFLALKADDPEGDDKVHRGTVAFAWGKTDKQVRKLVDQLRAELQPLVKTIGIDAILESVRYLQPEYKHLTRKPR